MPIHRSAPRAFALAALLSMLVPAAQAALRVPTLRELADRSTYVLDVRAASGKALKDATGAIWTDWRLEGLRPFMVRGRVPRDLTVRMRGGCLDGMCQFDAQGSMVKQGDRAVVFLAARAGEGGRCDVLDGGEGWYGIDAVPAGRRQVWTRDAEGAWTVRTGVLDRADQVVRGTVRYDAEHEVRGATFDELAAALRRLGAGANGVRRTRT